MPSLLSKEYTMVSEAQKLAKARYEKQKVKTQTVKFYPSEMDVYEHLSKQPNKMGYIKELIRKDMEASGE
jgi:hypothetical protein